MSRSSRSTPCLLLLLLLLLLFLLFGRIHHLQTLLLGFHRPIVQLEPLLFVRHLPLHALHQFGNFIGNAGRLMVRDPRHGFGFFPNPQRVHDGLVFERRGLRHGQRIVRRPVAEERGVELREDGDHENGGQSKKVEHHGSRGAAVGRHVVAGHFHHNEHGAPRQDGKYIQRIRHGKVGEPKHSPLGHVVRINGGYFSNAKEHAHKERQLYGGCDKGAHGFDIVPLKECFHIVGELHLILSTGSSERFVSFLQLFEFGLNVCHSGSVALRQDHERKQSTA